MTPVAALARLAGAALLLAPGRAWSETVSWHAGATVDCPLTVATADQERTRTLVLPAQTISSWAVTAKGRDLAVRQGERNALVLRLSNPTFKGNLQVWDEDGNLYTFLVRSPADGEAPDDTLILTRGQGGGDAGGNGAAPAGAASGEAGAPAAGVRVVNRDTDGAAIHLMAQMVSGVTDARIRWTPVTTAERGGRISEGRRLHVDDNLSITLLRIYKAPTLTATSAGWTGTATRPRPSSSNAGTAIAWTLLLCLRPDPARSARSGAGDRAPPGDPGVVCDRCRRARRCGGAMSDHGPEPEPEPGPEPGPGDPPAAGAGPGRGRDPFTVAVPETPPAGYAPPRRAAAPRTLRALLFAALMLVVATTVAAILVRRDHHPGLSAAGYPEGQGAPASGVILREDQTRQFEQLMAAMGQERKLAESENRRILAGIAAIQGAQGAQERRIARLEEIASDLVSRGLAKEAAQGEAAGLPEAVSPWSPRGSPSASACCSSAGSMAGRRSGSPSPSGRGPGGARRRRPAPPMRRPRWCASRSPMRTTTPSPLVRKRIALRIARDDLPALVHLVWNERATLPPSSAGQLVALANLVARADAAEAGPGLDGAAAGGLAQDQDLVVPREIRIGFQPCRSTDVVGIVILACPYLSGGLAIGEQDAERAAYGAARAVAVAGSFLRRRSARPQALLASLSEEDQRQERMPHIALHIEAGGDAPQRRFAAACLQGLVLARAVREGVQEAGRLSAWGAERPRPSRPRPSAGSISRRRSAPTPPSPRATRDPAVPAGARRCHRPRLRRHRRRRAHRLRAGGAGALPRRGRGPGRRRRGGPPARGRPGHGRGAGRRHPRRGGALRAADRGPGAGAPGHR